MRLRGYEMQMLESPNDKELPKRVINKAIETANKSTMRFKLGAVLYKRGKIIAYASNEKRTHPTFGSGTYNCLHAEINSIRRALGQRKKVAGASIFVFRENYNCSKPCASCQSQFGAYGIKSVYYVDRFKTIRRVYP
jgi:deoxycytidylate deaminase